MAPENKKLPIVVKKIFLDFYQKNWMFFHALLLLAALSIIAAINYFLPQDGPRLSRWNYRPFNIKNEMIIYPMFVAAYLINTLLDKRHKKSFLLIASLGIGIAAYGTGVLIIFVLAALFFIILGLDNFAVWKRCLWSFIIYEIFLYAMLNLFLDDTRYWNIFYFGYLFSIFFPLKFILLLVHKGRNYGVAGNKIDAASYFIYLFHPAYFLICPNIVVLPTYDHYENSFCELEEKIAHSRGLKNIFAGVTALLFIFLVSAPCMELCTKTENIFLAHVFTGIGSIIFISSYGNILVGLLNLLGYNVKPAFDLPLLSQNLIEFYRRYMIHFKGFLEQVFYFPISIKLKWVRSKNLRLSIAIILTVVLGTIIYRITGLDTDFCGIFFGRSFNDSHHFVENFRSTSHQRNLWLGASDKWLFYHAKIISDLNFFVFPLVLVGYIFILKMLETIKTKWKIFEVYPAQERYRDLRPTSRWFPAFSAVNLFKIILNLIVVSFIVGWLVGVRKAFKFN